MAANAMEWPAALMPRQVQFMPSVQSRSGGMTLNGSEQVVLSDAGRWQAKVAIAIRGDNRNLALRAFLAQMGGRAGTVLVPKWDLFRPVDANGRPFAQAHAAGYDDGSPQDGSGLNFDLSGFGQDAEPSAVLAANAVAGTTEIAVTLTDGEGPRPGHYFGLGQRLYLASHVWQEEVDGPTKVRFWPRARAAATAGTGVILGKPVCLMRFASDDAGSDMLSKRGSGTVMLDFVEAL